VLTRIARESPLPLFYLTREALREEITSGQIKPGERLPSEPELAKTLGVSLITLRRALMELQIEGLVEKVHGVGTFARERPLEQRLDHLSGFAEDMESLNFVPTAKVFGIETVPATEEIAEQLCLPVATPVVRIERLRAANGEPIMFNRAFFPLDLGERLKNEDLEQSPIITLIEQKFGTPLVEAAYRIEAAIAPPHIQRALEMTSNAPSMLVKRTSFAAGRRPVYYTQLYYRGDKFRYVVKVKRQPGAQQNVRLKNSMVMAN